MERVERNGLKCLGHEEKVGEERLVTRMYLVIVGGEGYHRGREVKESLIRARLSERKGILLSRDWVA